MSTESGPPAATYFHVTDAADSILTYGFRDGTGYYLTETEYTGVWLSDMPLDANGGPLGAQVLAVTTSVDLSEYEWIEKSKGYREWLVPAALLNESARIECCEAADQATERSQARRSLT